MSERLDEKPRTELVRDRRGKVIGERLVTTPEEMRRGIESVPGVLRVVLDATELREERG